MTQLSFPESICIWAFRHTLMALITHTLAVAFLLASCDTVHGSSLGHHLDGQDFNFSVVILESGTSFSTSAPPAEPIAFQDFLKGPPQITLKNLSSNFTGFGASYISFIVYTFVPTSYVNDDAVKIFPWVVRGQTLSENGTLSGGLNEATGRWDDWLYRSDNQVKDASVNVWLQTDRFSQKFSTDSDIIISNYIEAAWLSNSSDFPHSNIDFSIYNATESNSASVTAAQASAWMGLLPLCVLFPLLVMYIS
ncbi:hypothetical protein F5Y10DRAFT_257582 [Nemania abortiva]|nr:hypothetical protein F5Y10DRAFT_257582 [Nemania abortiva]